jgi:hypothetical protein
MSYNFLPENYQAPKSNNYYMKIQDGENKIRILSAPILGWEEWIEKVPFRYRFDQKPTKVHDPKMPLRHFWSFIVWNYNEEQIQVLHLSQATIRNSIESLSKDTDWGAPYFYDIKITKTGQKTDTEYMVSPLPHKPVGQHIIAAFKDRKCNLEALFDNQDPFSQQWNQFTPGIFDKEDIYTAPKSDKITPADAKYLQDMLYECSQEYQNELMTTLRKEPINVTAIGDIPLKLFERIKSAIIRKREEYQKSLAEFDTSLLEA